MLRYDLKKQPGRPLYDSLYEDIKRDILRGKLRAGARLPSKREMAEDNSVSLTTVVNAYQQLIMEGYIVSEEKHGYFVAELQAMPKALRQDDRHIKFYEEETWFADFRANNTLYHSFPYATWNKVIRSILSDYREELIMRGNPFGIEELRVQIADYLYRARGINVSPECIIIGAGIEYLYDRLITLFAPNAIYAVENPGYQKIPQIFRSYHLRWKSVDMDEAGVNMSDLRAKDSEIAHVSPEHHYPLGTIMPMTRRQELLAWAGEHDTHYIIEDDFDCEFRYGSRSIPALKSLDAKQKVIYMNTFSKTLSPAVRISYMVLPEHLMERYLQTTRFYTNSSSSLEQYAVARFIARGYFERHLSRIKKVYHQEGDRLRSILQNNARIPIKSLSSGTSGTHLLIGLDTEMSDETVREKAAARGVNVGFLSDYCTASDPRYEHTLILNFSNLDEATQREAIDRLGEIF